jgi:hypothetical protein
VWLAVALACCLEHQLLEDWAANHLPPEPGPTVPWGRVWGRGQLQLQQQRQR